MLQSIWHKEKLTLTILFHRLSKNHLPIILITGISVFTTDILHFLLNVFFLIIINHFIMLSLLEKLAIVFYMLNTQSLENYMESVLVQIVIIGLLIELLLIVLCIKRNHMTVYMVK